jgi:hypothetical protein
MSPSSHLTLRSLQVYRLSLFVGKYVDWTNSLLASNLLANSLLADVPAISSPPSLPANSLPAGSLLVNDLPHRVY